MVNLTLTFNGSELTASHHEMIGHLFEHRSLRRIVMFKHSRARFDAPVRLIFPSDKRIHVSNDFHGQNTDFLRYKVGNSEPVRITPQYHVRRLNLDFNNWMVYLLVDVLQSLPLLVSLEVKGCGQTGDWFCTDYWDRMLRNLKALRQVDIDIYICYPIGSTQERIQKLNDPVAQQTDTSKRINLILGIRHRQRGRGCFQFSASLNTNEMIDGCLIT